MTQFTCTSGGRHPAHGQKPSKVKDTFLQIDQALRRFTLKMVRVNLTTHGWEATVTWRGAGKIPYSMRIILIDESLTIITRRGIEWRGIKHVDEENFETAPSYVVRTLDRELELSGL